MTRYQNGNAVVFVLLGIVLFGLLSYTLINSAKTGQGNLTKHQAGLAAQEIVAYAKSIETVIQKLRSRGCSEGQLSFENPIVSGYTNASTPSDESCKIFNSAGGGMTWVEPKSNWLISYTDATALSALGIGYGQYNFPSTVCVEGMGQLPCNPLSGTKELVIGLKYLTTDICMQINSLLDNGVVYNTTALAKSPAGDHGIFTGTFYNGGVFITTELSNKLGGCINSNRTGNTFSYVLIAR